MTLLWLLACPGPETVKAPCDEYLGNEEVHVHCRSRLIVKTATTETVRARCAELGTNREGACRKAWVEARMHSPGTPPAATLLELCADMPDCAFQVLEFAPAADVLDQVRACERYAGPYVEDCAGHALQAWALTRPDAAERARVIEGAAAHPTPLGDFVAVALYCEGVRLAETDTYSQARAVGCPPTASAIKRCMERLRASPPPRCASGAVPYSPAPGSTSAASPAVPTATGAPSP